ncbi:MAG: GNAT family N-acetyltransferase [Acidobacteriota bacterium]
MVVQSTDTNGLAGDTDLIVRPLNIEDAGTVSAMLLAQPAQYSRFFFAFDFNKEQIIDILKKRVKDVYSGMFWRGELVGIFMLRGWDSGYEVPSFGVLVAEKFRGGALMKVSLDIAKLICRLMGAPRLMAKIHPDNVSPRGASRLGFVQTGIETETGNIVYHIDL